MARRAGARQCHREVPDMAVALAGLVKVQVRLTRHAIRRWRLRVDADANPNAVQALIKHRLATELRRGARVNGRGAIELEVRPGVWAVCMPSPWGGWDVVTICKTS